MRKAEFTTGTYLIVDGYRGQRNQLEDVNLIYTFLDNFPVQMDMTKIMPPYVFRYSGAVPEDWGVSGFVLIAESHISIHTFPEKHYLSIDVFSRKPFDQDEATEVIKTYFSLQELHIKKIDRGMEFPSSINDSLEEVRTHRERIRPRESS